MEIFTVDREYQIQEIIQKFNSLIWTERYYGDGEVQFTVPFEVDTLQRIPLGTLLGEKNSDELMILEKAEIAGGQVTYTGIGVLPWMNNRFFRLDPTQAIDYIGWGGGLIVGAALWSIFYHSAAPDSDLLSGDYGDWGVPSTFFERLKIPGLGLRDHDSVDDVIEFNGSPTQQLAGAYDMARQLAETYQIGMRLIWDRENDPALGFRAYRGVDRTSQQNENQVVRFSPLLDSLTNVSELHSVEKYKNLAFAYFTQAPADFYEPGIAWTEEASESGGFDLRVVQTFLRDNIDFPSSYINLKRALNSAARSALNDGRYVRAVDGDVVVTPQFKFGQDYFMGDLVEQQGETGIISVGRITEYIRSQNQSGIREYPTISEVETINTNIVSPDAST